MGEAGVAGPEGRGVIRTVVVEVQADCQLVIRMPVDVARDGQLYKRKDIFFREGGPIACQCHQIHFHLRPLGRPADVGDEAKVDRGGREILRCAKVSEGIAECARGGVSSLAAISGDAAHGREEDKEV